MTKSELDAALKRALDRFIERDRHLLAVNASERSMSHRIAMYLAEEIPDFDVDCEYNRDGFNVKRLQLNERFVTDDSEDAVTVFPDIVIHRRGNNDFNLFVIEMKKSTARENSDYDRHKLRAFQTELKYIWAAHVVVGYQHDGNFVCTVEWIDR